MFGTKWSATDQRRWHMFKEDRDTNKFTWNHLGDIQEGRPNLGPLCTVLGYRLLQYTLRDELIRQVGVEKGKEIFQNAGRRAGEEFCKELLDTSLDFNGFIADLQQKLKDHLVGILRIESADMDVLSFTLTIEEDLDCSGLPMCDDTVCEYDEGFVEGILNTYTGKRFAVKEIDCWASGDRVCRFSAVAMVD
jgi:predicted hydrocarbon binding protein